MLVFAGLGNPGDSYANHRHNIGFMALDAIAGRHGFGSWRGKFEAQAAQADLEGMRILLLKPQTFMNDSGRSISQALRFHKLEADALSAFHDEMDLPAGSVRIKTGGGAAGHRGIKSIDAHCGSEYRRIRLGVGHPGRREAVLGHVLSNFTQADRSEWLDELLDAIAENFALLAAGNNADFLASLPRPPSPPNPSTPPESGERL